MAGKRAREFAALLKKFRLELKLSKAETIGYFAVSSEVPSHVRRKAQRIIQREERKAEKAAR